MPPFGTLGPGFCAVFWPGGHQGCPPLTLNFAEAQGRIRMTLRNQNGFFTAEYLETEWYNTGLYDEPTGNEFIIKQKVWIILDSNQISVESVFGYMDGEEMVVFDSAPDELYRVVNALPEGLKQMILSKAL